jgi:hypothetical protein
MCENSSLGIGCHRIHITGSRDQEVLSLLTDTEETLAGAGLLMQSKMKEELKCTHSLDGRAAGSREGCIRVPRPAAFIEACGHGGDQSWKTGVMCH